MIKIIPATGNIACHVCPNCVRLQRLTGRFRVRGFYGAAASAG